MLGKGRLASKWQPPLVVALLQAVLYGSCTRNFGYFQLREFAGVTNQVNHAVAR